MTAPRHETDPRPTGVSHERGSSPGDERRGRHGGHGLMMMVTCVPMLLVAGFLVLTGAAGSGALVASVLCMAMMAAMMFMMPGGHNHK